MAAWQENTLGLVLDSLGVHYRKDNGWVRFKCLFACVDHEGGTDNTASACSRADNAGYFCHACSNKYPKFIYALHSLYRKLPKGQYKERVLFTLKKIEAGNLNLPAATGKDEEDDIKFYAYPDAFINSFPPVLDYPEGKKYLLSRRTAPELAVEFNIRFDTERKMVVVPYKNHSGHYAGAVGRSIVPNIPYNERHYRYIWEGHKNKRVWFNEHNTTTDKPLIVVEGVFDALRIYPYYKNVIATFGSNSQSSTKLSFLQHFSMTTIHLLLDNDAGGNSLRKAIHEYAAKSKDISFTLNDLHIPNTHNDVSELQVQYLLPILEKVDVCLTC